MAQGPPQSNASLLNPQAEKLLEGLQALEDRVHRSRHELESTAQLETLGLLAGAIAHEFNNILTPILSYARVALDAPEDQELGRRALERAATGAERASRIATSVLRLAAQAPADCPRESCAPSEALNGALTCLAEPLQDGGIELRCDIEAGLRVSMPQTDLEHVFLNLLLNAARALGEGGGEIQVSCSTWNTEARIRFSDSGPGVADDLVPHLFEPYHATSQDPESGQASHGLGLVICRQLLEAVGGSIVLDQAQGTGATFEMHLPLDDTK